MPYLVIGDAGAAMEDQRDPAGGLLDLLEGIEVEPIPIRGVDAVDVADAGGQEVNAERGDLAALLRIGDLAVGGDAVLGPADRADLGLDG